MSFSIMVTSTLLTGTDSGKDDERDQSIVEVDRAGQAKSSGVDKNRGKRETAAQRTPRRRKAKKRESINASILALSHVKSLPDTDVGNTR